MTSRNWAVSEKNNYKCLMHAWTVTYTYIYILITETERIYTSSLFEIKFLSIFNLFSDWLSLQKKKDCWQSKLLRISLNFGFSSNGSSWSALFMI